MKKQTSWGGVADWYDELLSGEGTYQKELILPNLIRLLALKKSDTVLDLACGQGFFAREFAKSGAKVVGADISPELIEIARKNSKNIDFHVASADSLPFLKNGSIDRATIVLAIQNIENISAVFKEVARVLKEGGRLFLVLNHPAFRIPKKSEWGDDRERGVQYRRLDAYMTEFKVPIEMHPGDDPREKTVSFHRPLQVYSKTLANAGFAITRIEEWTSNKKSQPGPRAKAENKARNEFPLFMMIEASKA